MIQGAWCCCWGLSCCDKLTDDPAHAAMYYEKAAHLIEADRALATAESMLHKALRCRVETRLSIPQHEHICTTHTHSMASGVSWSHMNTQHIRTHMGNPSVQMKHTQKSIHVHTQAYARTHTHTHIHTHTHMYTHACIHACTRTHTHIQTHTHAYKHKCTHTYTRTHTQMHTRTRTRTHAHTHMHTHTHTTRAYAHLTQYGKNQVS